MGRDMQVYRQWEILHRLSDGSVTRQELAQTFDVSLKTIKRDVEMLELHFPIQMERQSNDIVYSFIPGYKLPGIWFTPREVASLLIGRQAIQQSLKGTPHHHAFLSILNKVERLHRSAQCRAELRLPEVYQSDFATPRVHADVQEELLYAAAEQKCVRIRYFTASRNSESERVVEPFMVRLTIHGLHLIAYCRENRDFRYFTINRILSLKVLDESFEPEQRRFNLQQFLKESFGGVRREPILHVRLLIREPTSFWAQDLHYHPTQQICEVEGGIELSFDAGGLEAIARRVVGLGPDCEILEPECLKKTVAQYIQQLLKKYEPIL